MTTSNSIDRFKATLLFIVAVFSFVDSASAHYQRHLEAVLPRVGRQGTTVEVRLQGKHINDPKEIIFFREGIRAVEIEQLPDLQQFDENGKLNPIDNRPGSRQFYGKVVEQVRAKFIIEPDCPIGLHPIKMRTGDHLTTLSFFWVTPFPVQDEAEPLYGGFSNNAVDVAEVVEQRNATVFGYIQPNREQDIDYYRITRKKGERISVEVNSVRLSTLWWSKEELDLAVRILDADGKELAWCDDSPMHVQDPVVSTIAPKDGDYFIEIAQALFKNGNNTLSQHYIAHIGDYERPRIVFPLGGQPGTKLQARFMGDVMSDRDVTVQLPNTEQTYQWDFGGPSVMPMRVSNHRNVIESNSDVVTDAGATPVALNGIISKRNEVDTFRVHVQKGQSYLVRMYARSLGTSLDSHLIIRHEDTGEVEAERDDARNYEERDLIGVPTRFRRLEIADPSEVWTPRHDGTYLIEVSDATHLGTRYSAYRVEVAEPDNRINTALVSLNYSRDSVRDTSLAIPRGGRWTVRVFLGEGHGSRFTGDIRLVAQGLPKGVRMIAPNPIKYDGSYPRNVAVQFIADESTEPRGAVIRLLARPVDESQSLKSDSLQSFQFVGDHFGTCSNSLIVDRFALAVTNPAPYSLEVIAPPAPLNPNGRIAAKVKLHRKPGFTEPILISSIRNPGGVSSQPEFEMGPDQSEATIEFSASASPKIGTFPIALQGTTLPEEPRDVAGTGRLRVSSPFFDLKIARSYVTLTSEPIAVRRGGTGTWTWKVNHELPFTRAATATLIRLPRGIELDGDMPMLKPDSKELVFKLVATDEALLGQTQNIGVSLTFQENGYETSQTNGTGSIRVDPAISN